MEQHNIPITKTGRFFTIGNRTDPDEVWFVLHGYGQLANYFLKKFQSLDNGKRLIIAPEGLHRFYWNGFSGRVVASWMTKEDRLTDISDYVQFLDQVYGEVISSGNVKIRLLGFSQGTATACRWAVQGNSKFDQLILWAGAFPPDVDYFENSQLLNSLDLTVVIGNEDQYYAEEKVQAHLNELSSRGIQYRFIEFNGDHNIYEEPLQQLT